MHSIQKKRLAAAMLTCAVLHQQSVPQPPPIPVQNNAKPDLTLHFLHAPAISQGNTAQRLCDRCVVKFFIR